MNMQAPINGNTSFLVVDDFEPMRKVTAGQLRAMGAHTVHMARNGAEALRMLKKQPVDIVLSDWNMPVMTGLELLKAMRSDVQLMTLPFIMITAEAERHRIEEAIANGVSDLLVKPYTAGRLASHIKLALIARPRSTVARNPVAPKEAPLLPKTPTHQAPSETPSNTEGSTGDNPGMMTILIVDDLPDNLLLLAHLFKNDYQVRIAHSGEKALTLCQSGDPPDLVLLDIMMPDMDGFEVIRRMREHPASQAIPVIFVSAMTDTGALIRGLGLGAVDFVTKPIDPEVLVPRVHNFMRYVELHKQLQASYDGMLELAHLREDIEHITRHDLKGPLAGVIGLVQSLLADPDASHRQAETLKAIEQTSLQLLDMINLSAELFKIETGRFTLDAKPVKIDDILRRIVDMARTTFSERHLTLTFDNSPAVDLEKPQAFGDAMFCYSLFNNLIKNACEASPDNGHVTVTVSAKTTLSVIIRNQGAVPVAIRQRFFEKYVTSGKPSGTGLGTYSAKLFAEAQHGSITLAVSDKDNQTTITVSLPLHGSVPKVPSRQD